MMRVIAAKKITDTVKKLCIEANQILRSDALAQIKAVYLKEKNKRAKVILAAIVKNAIIARKEKLAICQDTGMPILFLEMGQDIRIAGNLKSAINKGVKAGYRNGYLRESIIKDPISRGKTGYLPAIIHTDIVKGDKLKITVLPKGFGCENKSGLRMFKPTAKLDEIKKFILDTVKTAGADACPPVVIGVGIGGTADYAMYLAKKALLRKIKNQKYKSKIKNTNQKSKISNLENELLKGINKLNIGPMGLGGKTTALGVNIKAYPTHIAGLPVAVNISCHALRSATVTL